jgi:general secretion pathway protein E
MKSVKLASQQQVIPRRGFSLEFALQLLAEDGVINAKTSDFILKQCATETDHPFAIISRFSPNDLRPPHLPLTMDSLSEWMAKYCELPFCEIDPLKIDIKAAVQVLPTAYVRRLQIIPVKIEAKEILIATSDPFTVDWIEQVQDVCKKKVHLAIANPKAIRYFIEEFSTVRSATREFKKNNADTNDFGGRVLELDRMLGKAQGNDLGKDAAAVIRIVDWLFQFAYDERATDIHMEPKKGKGQIRFRIDGRMRAVYSFEPALMLPLVTRMKLLADMQLDEKRKPQDGRIRYKLGKGQEMEMRLATIPAQHGEKIVVRIFDPKMAGKDFVDLGFLPEDIKKWDSLIDLPHGLVLVTGPTGSGKSTTLHTSMRKIANEDVNICTIEDPIEIVNDDLNQVQVNAKVDLTFGEAIRAFLRQDPDIMMVGEIRDADAAKMAIQAALTGHLVLSTLHTNDAISSITRLIDLGIPPHLIAASLRGMMAQRLVRRLCDFCKEKIPTPTEAWRELTAEHKIPEPPYVYAPVGCRECKNTGYRGRVCLYEIVVMNREIKTVVRKSVGINELLDAAKGSYVPLQINGIGKVIEGITSLEEVLRVIF